MTWGKKEKDLFWLALVSYREINSLKNKKTAK